MRQYEDMKKQITLLFLLTVLLGFSWPSHAGEGDPLILQGEVLLSTVQGSLFIAVDQEDPSGAAEGGADWLFALQGYAEAARVEALRLPMNPIKALVFFDARQLVVRSPELEGDLVLTVADPEILPSNPFSIRDGSAHSAKIDRLRPRIVIEGVGLMYQQGEKAPLFESLGQLEQRAPDMAQSIVGGSVLCPDGDGNGNVDCYSGGCGATQCSGSCMISPSCGISCTSGYFACCSCDFWGPGGCKCYSNSLCGCS